MDTNIKANEYPAVCGACKKEIEPFDGFVDLGAAGPYYSCKDCMPDQLDPPDYMDDPGGDHGY